MHSKNIILGFFILFSFSDSFAQVTLQTGAAVFSLPMFNWQDDKSRLNTVVALSYSSGNGLKVSDVASNVGQGWNLVAGGVISRMQVGEPDDQQAYVGDGTEFDIRKYPAGYIYATDLPYNGCSNKLIKYPLYGGQNMIYKQGNRTTQDKQLDYFAFQFNGKTGMFILDNVNGLHAVPLGDTKMKISLQTDFSMATNNSTGIRTTITSFTVNDVDGLTYIFSKHGLTEVLEQNYCDDKLIQAQKQPSFKGGSVIHQYGYENLSFVNPWIITNWYLDRVIDSLTMRVITFNYNNNSNIPYLCDNGAGVDMSYNQWHDYTIMSHKRSITKTFELTSIILPDSHVVKLNYATQQRIDFNGEFALSSVKIDYTLYGLTRTLSQYQLNTSYFILNRYGTPTTPYQKLVSRLCLRSVAKIGVDLKEDSPPYIFDYYLGSSNSPGDDYVPPPFYWAKDIWGYYNGANSTDFSGVTISLLNTWGQLTNNQCKGLCYFKNGQTAPAVFQNAKNGFAKNGLLRQIIYPTGGTLTYTYAQNTGKYDGTPTDVTIGGVHTSLTSSTDGGFSNPCGTALSTQYNYVVNGTGSPSSLWGVETPVNTIMSGSSYAPEHKRYVYNFQCLPFGCCGYEFMYPGILSQSEVITLEGFQKIMQTLGPYLGVLTLITDIMDVVTVACGSTGFLAWAAVVVDFVGGIVTLGITCLTDYSKSGSTTVYFNNNLNDAAPLPTQYKRVEVVENPGTIGKTVQEFTSSDDYSVWVPAGANPNFTTEQRFAPWAYGLPKKTTIYDALGNIIKQTENKYDTSWAATLIDGCFKCFPYVNNWYTPLVSCKCGVLYSTSQRNTDWTGLPETLSITPTANVLTVDFYGMYTGRFQLDTTFERLFSVPNPVQKVETATYYDYNAGLNFEPAIITTKQSNGDLNYKYIKYSSDYSGGVIDAILKQNIVALPISTYSSVNKASDGQNYYLQEKVTELGQLSNGDIKPMRILEQRLSQPSTTLSLYGGPGSNTTNYKVSQVFTYDTHGNTVGMQDEGARKLVNIYGYKEKYITATIINADPTADHCAYTSFEVPDFSNTGWTLNGSAVYSPASAATGSQCFTLNGSNSLTSALNVSKSYILSCWAIGSPNVSAGGSLVKSGPTYNGFTYYEYSIAVGTSSITITGNTNIDELRLYPANARMRTVTYDPLIGKTSESDENNRITYYEYDNLGRLLFVKDEAKNVIKMYEYNNVSTTKQNGCPGTYSNNLLVELFTRSNCSSGFLGTDVPVTIPAGRYSSNISQADADAQAETDALTNGPTTANTTGGCNQIFYNPQKQETDSSQSCPLGFKGGFVTYTVPAGKYSSTASLTVATQYALDELAANALAYANSPYTRICISTTDPKWEADAPSFRCQTDANNNSTGHKEAFLTDDNPNSATYHTQQWKDIGIQDGSCPPTAGSPPTLSATGFSSVSGSGVITGVPGTQVSITITLNSSASDAHLTGNVGGNVNLTGSGNTSTTNVTTIPATGYISWNLTLTGTKASGGYVSSNISVN